MIYTRQQAARDTLDYVAAVAAYVESTAGVERGDAVAFWTACNAYAMEQYVDAVQEVQLAAELDQAC